MTQQEQDSLLDKIDAEGFDYAFAEYSRFSSIKDEEFHSLRKQYLQARQMLADYIGAEI